MTFLKVLAKFCGVYNTVTQIWRGK